MVCKLHHSESHSKKQKDGGLKELEEKSRQKIQGGHTAWGWKEEPSIQPPANEEESLLSLRYPQEPGAEELLSSMDSASWSFFHPSLLTPEGMRQRQVRSGKQLRSGG